MLTPRLLLLLVVHDDDLHHLAVAAEENAQVSLRNVGRETTEEHLRVPPSSLRLLKGARVARLRIDGSRKDTDVRG